jgi:hypothetical protein
VNVRSASSRLLARVLVSRRALSGGRGAKQVEIGRLSRRLVHAGPVSFKVTLTAAGRRALRRNGRLSISLRLSVTPPSGTAYRATRIVILRLA